MLLRRRQTIPDLSLTLFLLLPKSYKNHGLASVPQCFIIIMRRGRAGAPSKPLLPNDQNKDKQTKSSQHYAIYSAN